MAKKDIKISIDPNCNYLGFLKPTISPFEIEYFNLMEGDRIIGFQDEQEWEGIVKFSADCPEEQEWYLDIKDAKEYSVSQERQEGRDEGARTAIPIGEIRGELRVVTAMLADGMALDLVKKYTRLSKSRLENILQNL